MSRNKTILLLSIGIIICGGIFYGYQMYNAPVATLKNVKSDITIQASDLLKLYKENESTANTAYLDKIIAVTGEIDKVESQDGISIYLKTEDPLSQVICQLDNSYTQIDYSSGDNITIKGLCTGYLMDVILVNSTIIN